MEKKWNVGFLGLGNLGMPLAYAFKRKGHEIFGYDLNPLRMKPEWFKEKEVTEEGDDLKSLIVENPINYVDSLEKVLKVSDVVFITVQTPNETGHDGTVPFPKQRKNYNLKPLIKCLQDIAEYPLDCVLVLCSTVLPGTIRSTLLPILKDTKFSLVHNPMFCAMGTVIPDIYNPEFVLLGADDESAAEKVKNFYRTINDAEIVVTNFENAEMVKTTYNGFITMKINYANTLMEMAHKIPGCNCDTVMDCLFKATDRLISTKYLRGAMGDGGGCLPAGSIIFTSKGPVEIQDIESGDIVLSKDGCFHRVKETFKREYDGFIYNMSSTGVPDIAFTEEHPILVSKDMRKIYPFRGGKKRHGLIKENTEESEFIKVSDLTNNYFTLFPVIKENIDVEDIHLSRLIGYYLAEGSIYYRKDRDTNSRVSFWFNESEKEYQDEVEKYLKEKFGKETNVIRFTKNNCTEIRVNSIKIATFFASFGKGAENKYIPEYLLTGCNKNAEAVLYSLFRGDGSSHKQGYSFSTISEDLAYGVLFLLSKLKIPSNLRIVPARFNGYNHRLSYEIRVRNTLYLEAMHKITGMDIKMKKAKQTHNTVFVKDNFIYRKIKKIEKKRFRGPVYNFSVEDEENYITNCGVVHNCHPKENSSLSWLAQQLNLSFDWFEMNMTCRERQTEWLADLICEQVYKTGYGVAVFGTAFKPETNLEDGSPSLLLIDILKRRGIAPVVYDPFVERVNRRPVFDEPAVFFIAMRHGVFKDFDYPDGSIVIDPWRYISSKKDVDVIRVGE